MGRLSLSVNPFVPKPWTPFQWIPMQEVGRLDRKRALLERELGPLGVGLDFLPPRRAFFQALLSRGDRRAADLLEAAWLQTGGDLRRALARWPHDPGFFATREAAVEERLPWDFIDQGVDKAFLARELRRGVAGKLTSKCRLETCRACGLDCADRAELALPGRAVP